MFYGLGQALVGSAVTVAMADRDVSVRSIGILAAVMLVFTNIFDAMGSFTGLARQAGLSGEQGNFPRLQAGKRPRRQQDRHVDPTRQGGSRRFQQRHRRHVD